GVTSERRELREEECDKRAGRIAVEDRMDANDILRGQYWLTRVVFLRCLGFVYAAAFLSALRDNAALLGEDGLLPATRFMSRVQQHLGHLTPWEKVLKLPTIFWFTPPTADNLFWAAAVGATVSCVVALRGAGNLPAMALLWGLYHSIVNVGQTWYAFGWESQLLETGFLAMFLVPWLSLSRFPEGSPTSSACVWAYRWLLFRIMLGAGLIKLRGDPCWQDLTCMDYHYQTQPNPNPLSRYLHHLPSAGWHKVEVLVNHVVELVLPWCLLLTRRQRCFAGVVQILFQVALVVSGNLSFLNWLTAVPAVFSFDDLHLARFFDRGVVERLVRRLLPQEAAAPRCGGDGYGSGGGDGSGGDAGKDGAGGANRDVGEASAEFPVIGSGSEPRSRRGSGPGVPLREIASRRPELARAQSTLQWSGAHEGGPETAEKPEPPPLQSPAQVPPPATGDRCVSHANDESSRAAGKRGVRATPSRARRALRWAADALLVALVVKGSVPVVKNMAGGGQKMNTSFDSLRIVNTYGNFGSVTKTRGEVVLKGTRHPDPLDPAAEWKEYGFRCKPGDVNQRPCVITPFHYRLDWQMWFAAFQNYGHNPWLVSLVSKLLSTDDNTRALAGSLLRHDPFSLGDAGDG
ncbi:unnamed protein product, partial [Scytosiphon promiscuus]